MDISLKQFTGSPDAIARLKMGFIGAGRLATALAWMLDGRGCSVHAVASRSARNAEKLAGGVRDAAVLDAQGVADCCDLVFITTPDGAIAQTADALSWRPEMGVVHCSGATEVSVLAKAASEGALIGGFHPMQAFVDPRAAMRTLPGCVITIEARDPVLDELLGELAQVLDCTAYRLPHGARARYHAAAGYASQHVNVLFAQAVRIWQSWGGTEEDALRALLPLAYGTLASIETSGAAQGMPGPVSRGDAGTIRRHVQALSDLGDGTIDLYRCICLHGVEVALGAGKIDEDAAARLREILSH
ncbi:Rossmann-like and DUF2520 domain-containing protein [Allopusillimonas soli]|uniref:DUF2520 domain-containing protein n=1 Tax=Allopusillimonas soli TaxID=659016 RepID=A0A853F8W1_9BURK|nr:DUF2520 domain-containing protein [Allopusillimonas soli]NYT36238.1 DUF2520 domain-containing protein [Allopusillimonas soli]